MINENDAWNSFFESGSVQDYLTYKEIQHALSDGKPEEEPHEVQDQGTDRQTAEYR